MNSSVGLIIEFSIQMQSGHSHNHQNQPLSLDSGVSNVTTLPPPMFYVTSNKLSKIINCLLLGVLNLNVRAPKRHLNDSNAPESVTDGYIMVNVAEFPRKSQRNRP